MKKILALTLIVIGGTSLAGLYGTGTSFDDQTVVGQAPTEEIVLMADSMMDEFYDSSVQDELQELVIEPTKGSVSWRDIPFYIKLFFSQLYQDRIKPAYYAVVGYLSREKVAE